MTQRTGLFAVGIWLVFLAATAAIRGPYSGQLLAAQDAGKLTFELYKDNAQEFRWRLKSANGQILATSGQGYKAKADCQKGVQRIKDEVDSDKLKFEVYQDNAKEHRFRVLATNGQVVAVSSEGYEAKADCEKVIELMKKGAAKAAVEDKT